MKELIDLQQFQKWLVAKWRTSLGLFFALVVGIVVGMLIVEGRVIDDCRFLKTFRFGNQAFSCLRVM